MPPTSATAATPGWPGSTRCAFRASAFRVAALVLAVLAAIVAASALPAAPRPPARRPPARRDPGLRPRRAAGGATRLAALVEADPTGDARRRRRRRGPSPGARRRRHRRRPRCPRKRRWPVAPKCPRAGSPWTAGWDALVPQSRRTRPSRPWPDNRGVAGVGRRRRARPRLEGLAEALGRLTRAAVRRRAAAGRVGRARGLRSARATPPATSLASAAGRSAGRPAPAAAACIRDL